LYISLEIKRVPVAWIVGAVIVEPILAEISSHDILATVISVFASIVVPLPPPLALITLSIIVILFPTVNLFCLSPNAVDNPETSLIFISVGWTFCKAVFNPDTSDILK